MKTTKRKSYIFSLNKDKYERFSKYCEENDKIRSRVIDELIDDYLFRQEG